MLDIIISDWHVFGAVGEHAVCTELACLDIN